MYSNHFLQRYLFHAILHVMLDQIAKVWITTLPTKSVSSTMKRGTHVQRSWCPVTSSCMLKIRIEVCAILFFYVACSTKKHFAAVFATYKNSFQCEKLPKISFLAKITSLRWSNSSEDARQSEWWISFFQTEYISHNTLFSLHSDFILSIWKQSAILNPTLLKLMKIYPQPAKREANKQTAEISECCHSSKKNSSLKPQR